MSGRNGDGTIIRAEGKRVGREGGRDEINVDVGKRRDARSIRRRWPGRPVEGEVMAGAVLLDPPLWSFVRVGRAKPRKR